MLLKEQGPVPMPKCRRSWANKITCDTWASCEAIAQQVSFNSRPSDRASTGFHRSVIKLMFPHVDLELFGSEQRTKLNVNSYVSKTYILSVLYLQIAFIVI